MTRRDFPEAHRQSGPTGQGTGTALPRTPAAMTPQMRRLYSGPAVEPSVSLWEAAQRRMDLFAYQESDEWALICAHVNTAAPLPRHREDTWWRQRQRSAILAGLPPTPRGMRSRLVWRVMKHRDEWHLICAHVNTAPPPTPPPTFAHEPMRVAVQYQLEATAPSLRPEPPAAPRVIDAATEFARQQCVALVAEMRTWGPAA